MEQTIWWNVCDIGKRAEYDYIKGLEVKLIGEWWITESEDASVAIVMLEVVIRRRLEQVLNES